jgi:site-specific DNA recombinase
MEKYFIYVRKSTDEEDRQVLSIEAQLAELKEFAAKEKLEIAASLCEAKTAKEPGRKIFGQMIDSIEKGEADGILSWHPDRLARNPIDGGRIIYMVDTGKIKSLKFPTFWFENTPQGKFMLNIAFGQSKYYIDNLSENVKRGFRQKLRRGEYPGWAPIGYVNDLKTHSIILDAQKHELVKRIFDLYSTGDYTLKQITQIADDIGLKSYKDKHISVSMIQKILQNPFYCGLFRYKGEIYQGVHEPIMAKKLFDRVQEVLKRRGRIKPHKHNFVFTGLMKCGTCGCSITAETKKGHIYYRCTKKKNVCNEKYAREELILEKLKQILFKVSLPDDWADKMVAEAEKEKLSSAQSSNALVFQYSEQLKVIENKLEKLLDAHLENVIEKDDYLRKKEQFFNAKLELEEKLSGIKNKGNNWLEPLKDFIFASKSAKKIACGGDLSKIKSFVKNIGSNFILKDKKIEFLADFGWRALVENSQNPRWLGRRDSNP